MHLSVSHNVLNFLFCPCSTWRNSVLLHCFSLRYGRPITTCFFIGSYIYIYLNFKCCSCFLRRRWHTGFFPEVTLLPLMLQRWERLLCVNRNCLDVIIMLILHCTLCTIYTRSVYITCIKNIYILQLDSYRIVGKFCRHKFLPIYEILVRTKFLRFLFLSISCSSGHIPNLYMTCCYT